MLVPNDLATSQSGEGPRADHPLHKPFLTLVFPMKAFTKWGLLSTACPGRLAQHPQHTLPFLPTTCGQCGLHCARARISSRVQKLYTKVHQSLSRTRSTAAPRRLTSYKCNKRRQRTTGKSGQHPQLRWWESQGNKTCYRKRRERGSPCTHDPDSCRGVRPPRPRT